ncbi:hypothetical protein ABXW85_23680, partial [Streptococcus suis]
PELGLVRYQAVSTLRKSMQSLCQTKRSRYDIQESRANSPPGPGLGGLQSDRKQAAGLQIALGCGNQLAEL